MSQLERHHWIPLSIHGIDHGSNIAVVTHDLHLEIHKAMNYKYRTFTSAWRKFRKKHNHKVFTDEEMVDDILRMQYGYLNRWRKLPPVAQRLHFQKMNELCLFYNPHHRWDTDWNFLWKKYEDAYKATHSLM